MSWKVGINEQSLRVDISPWNFVFVPTSLTSSPAFFACRTSSDCETSQPTPFIQFMSDLYCFYINNNTHTHSVASILFALHGADHCFFSTYLRGEKKSYITLQPVGFLCPGDAPVCGQSRVLVEEGPVVGLGCQVLSLLGVADVDHVQIDTGHRDNFITLTFSYWETNKWSCHLMQKNKARYAVYSRSKDVLEGDIVKK